MRNIIKISMMLAVLIMAGCQSSDDDNTIPNVDENAVILNEDNSNRVIFDNLGVVTVKGAPQENPETSARSFKSTAAKDLEPNDLPLVQIAKVSAPVYKGTTLRATHIDINGKYAYVSYNVEGPTYMGAIDVIDISDPLNPSVALQAIFPNTDISSVDYYENALYLAGANAGISDSNPAILMKMPLQNGMPTENIELMTISGFVATDVAVSASGIYGVSGDNGEVIKYNLSSLQIEETTALADLRAVGINDNKVVALSGTEGIHVYNSNNLNENKSFATSKDAPEAKRTIDFYDKNVLVAEGAKGLGIYNINNGSKLKTIDVPVLEDQSIDVNDVVTNAVSVEDKHIFTADGAAGISVYTITGSVSDLTTIGSLDLTGSANYVKSANGYIFVADGKAGLKILKTVTPDNGGINCTDFPTYTGGYWLNVNSNQDLAYRGSASLMGINVNSKSSLTFCGALAVNKGINVNSGGLFTVKGSLAQGTTEAPYNALIVNNKATLQIEGSLVVYGDMILNNGATLEFLGNGSSITVYGKVKQNGNVTIKGNYTDTFNSLKK
ncbi:hypothetical protein HX109_03535 [Galbibacter sp. BG1]|uniref:hypothetical protein n=1 Tax=Galbibacter sp. BG1 TaxID=1170699 RepID=UPI0015BB5A28|nr:hypothetical protein [Galbibacter sp. BG1]QLE00678.1 hypothetical protein HX109_03535 [Galbibacter sp. BG1]